MLSMIVAAPWVWWRSRHKVLLAISMAGFALLAIPVMAGPEIRARFMTLENNEVDASANSRRASWKAAWEMAKDNPVFGVGLRNSNLFSYDYGADLPGRTIHNQYLQILADCGFPGLAMYLLMLAGAVVGLHRCRRRFAGRADPDARQNLAITNGLECALLTFMFGSVFLSLELFEILYLLQLLAVQLAVVTGAWEKKPGWLGHVPHLDNAAGPPADGIVAGPPAELAGNVLTR
jgi:O-antigen ligase